MSARAWPWLEGLLLAALVSAILVAGGEAVRASYHGYLHVSVGEAVLRDGLRPENPYHAGVPLRYYTLYPLLGVITGQLGQGGPLWAFALWSVVAALLLPPALDAFGKRCGLSHAARRASFWCALLGFNAFGWLGFLFSSGEPFGTPPVYALMPLTFARESFGWDARLQAFLPKFLNVSSYALALPFLLWALAALRARWVWLPLGVCLALNPIVGAFAALVIAIWRVQEWRTWQWKGLLQWGIAGILAVLLALPFLLPSFVPAPQGPSLSGNPQLGGSALANLLGPQHALLWPALAGLCLLPHAARWSIAVPAVLAAVAVAWGEMPQGNEYKLARLLGLVLALPAGVWCAAQWQRGRAWLPLALAALSLPTFAASVWAYLRYGESAPPLVLEARNGRMIPKAWAEQALSYDARMWESYAPEEAVLVVPPQLFRGAQSRALVQGSLYAPVAHHALYADLPQIHNEGQPDLGARLDELSAFYLGTPAQAQVALAAMRARLADRPLVLMCVPPAHEAWLAESGAEEVQADTWYLKALKGSR
jgi:hypothetical protein